MAEYLQDISNMDVTNEQEAMLDYYLPKVVEEAIKVHTAGAFIGDLIQEANVSLMQALGGAGEELRDETWLLGELRKGIQAVLDEQSQQKFADDSLVAKVEKLENAVRDLSDDEDGKCEFSVAELAVILDMDVEEIRNTLRLTGDDK